MTAQPDYPVRVIRGRRSRFRRAIALPSVDAPMLLGFVCVLAVTAGVATFSVGLAVIVLGIFAGALAVLLARLPEEPG